MKPNTCPFCKKNFSDQEILNNTKIYKRESDIKVADEDEFTFIVDVKCPNENCGFSDSHSIQSINTEIDYEAGQKYALYFWKEILNPNPEKDICPSCGYKVNYNKEDFIYPKHFRDVHLDEREYNITCTSNNYDCCLSYDLKSKLKKQDLYNKAKLIWDKIYE